MAHLLQGVFSRKGQAFYLVIAFITVLIMALGADKGGLMVYKYGVGVKAVRTAETEGHIHAGEEDMAEGTEEERGHGQATRALAE